MACAKKTTTATTKVEKKVVEDNTVSVKFQINLVGAVADEVIYLVGNDKKIGAWDATKGKALKINKNGAYVSTAVKFEKGSIVEFKVCKTASWDNVEISVECNDLANHVFTADEDKTVTIDVYNFR